MDISKIPFSRFGSYFAVGRDESGRAILRTLRGDCPRRDVFRIAPLGGAPFAAAPRRGSLGLEAEGCELELYLRGPDEVVIRGRGDGLRLDFLGAGELGYVYADAAGDAFQVVDRENKLFFQAHVVEGSASLDARWKLHDRRLRLVCETAAIELHGNGGPFTLYIRADLCERPISRPALDADKDIARVEDEYSAWTRRFSSAAPEYERAAADARYVLWSSAVSRSGNYRYDGMLMSKNWMTSVWSWDHCFNALAMVGIDDRIAAEQFLIMLEAQQESGKLPDKITDRSSQAIYTKPPVHGWCYSRMRERGLGPDRTRDEAVLRRLMAWTDWWFAYRDDDRDLVCSYNHGNECGWDNSTVFDDGVPIESPDLPAFMILQIDEIARLASELGDESLAASWKSRGEALMKAFLAHCFASGLPVARRSRTHEPIRSRSLLPFMALVLGDRLPSDLFKAMVERLEEEFLTEYGVATEAPSSPKYIAGASYWRGAIWAPTTYLLADGLRRGGADALARKVAIRFLDTVARGDTMSENYCSRTGVGCDDPAYTWTASVFLMLAREFAAP